MRLTDEELRGVLARAEEIERAAREGAEWNAELAAVIGAAEEVGFSRQAVERALAERLNLPAAPPVVGSLTWARSADGKFYVAEVLSTSEEGTRVRFLRGSEHRLALDELRPCAFIPGERVACHWPMWGPWTCTVIGYDSAKQRVKLSDGWGYTKTFPLSEVWLARTVADPRAGRKRVYATLLGAGAAVGALIGSIITALLMR
ncbi:MAG: tudor domain-containing protein [Gemmatimonadales bacterium]